MKRKNSESTEPGPCNRYQVERKGGFYVAYQEDGGGQDRGPTEFGTFISEEEARVCLRRAQRDARKKKNPKHRKKK